MGSARWEPYFIVFMKTLSREWRTSGRLLSQTLSVSRDRVGAHVMFVFIVRKADGEKKNKYKRRRANNLNLHTRVRIVRIITWNSGADKKKSPVFKWSVTAAAQALDRLCSFSRQQGSQERYQSARPPCEMSSLSRGLWDCCHHPNSLWMSASLTGQLDDAAPHHRQQTHFQLSSFIPSYFFHFFYSL